jgi:Cu/Ag efflux protein CusF
MRAWKVVLLVNLALLLGLGGGYVWWGRRAATLARELAVAREQTERLQRELAAARAGAPVASGEQQWQAKGVVRAVLRDLGIVVLTHEEIPGYMPSMTMGFRTASPQIHEAVRPGDTVRFTLRGTPPNLAITAIEKLG